MTPTITATAMIPAMTGVTCPEPLPESPIPAPRDAADHGVRFLIIPPYRRDGP